MTEPQHDRPEESTQADVTLVARGLTATAQVEVSNENTIVVRPLGEGTEWKRAIKPGDPVALYWVSGYEERSLPAKITSVEVGEEPLWHLVPTGPAERSQRRRTVRARVEVPVVMPWLDGLLVGSTVDLSEAGLRALVDGWGLPPEPGTRAHMTLTIGDDTVDVRGAIVRQQVQGARWLLSMQFHDVEEKDADGLRRRVFQALREERAAALD
ncbi:PilZ domain-containing protein [Blastococcus sp. DSM 46786]|uniref:PilZ domain-containing protein n=1 Tax=Blastococcus sp. DSM 46786 TaxID=1798227 RepID=UPI0008C44C25|nr:PilZ domain-containing protein [Blastococcus sp. DSM 46786]SEL11002.1 PilZ domain-containing protein [Blastococcus sp. DSM 46786]